MNSSTGTAAASGSFSFAEIKRLTRQGVLEAGQIYNPPLLRCSTFANFCSLLLARASFFADMIWPSFAKGYAHGLRIGSIGRLAIQRLLQQ